MKKTEQTEDAWEALDAELAKNPGDRELLADAYALAQEREHSGRRLYYALQLTKSSPVAEDFVRYGRECLRNLMPDIAEKAFEEAIRIGGESAAALNGIGSCRLAVFRLNEAEAFFRRSLRLEATPSAEAGLEEVRRLRDPRTRTPEDERLRKFWRDRGECELDRISEEERQLRMAKAVVKGLTARS